MKRLILTSLAVLFYASGLVVGAENDDPDAPEMRWQQRQVPAARPRLVKHVRPMTPTDYVITEKDGLASAEVTSITQYKDGAMVFGTEHGLSILRGDGVETYTGKDYSPAPGADNFRGRQIPGNSWLPSNRISSVYSAPDGTLWIGTHDGACRISDGLWHVLTLAKRRGRGPAGDVMVDDLQGLNSATAFYAAPNGKFVIGSYNLGVTIVDDTKNEITTVRFRAGEFHDNSMMNPGWITGIAADATGGLWLGTSNGVLYHDWKTFKEHTKEPWVPGKMVRALCLDRAGNLWVGTHNGLGVRFADASSKVFTKADVLLDNTVWSLLCAADGRVWALTDKGLCVFDGKGWTYPVCKTQLRFCAGTMFQAADDAMWFTAMDGVARNPGFTFQTASPVAEALAQFKAKVEKEYPNVTPSPLVLKDAKGRVWAGREDGVDRYDGKAWTSIPLGLDGNTLAFIKTDSRGRVWIGTQGAGLFGYDGDTTVRYNNDPEHSKSVIYGMAESKSGTLYFGTQHGLYVLKREAWTRQEGLEELGCQQVGPIALDDKDRLWMADYNSGLFILDGKATTHISKQRPLQGRHILEITPLRNGMVQVRTVMRTEAGEEEKSFHCDGQTCTPATDAKR